MNVTLFSLNLVKKKQLAGFSQVSTWTMTYPGHLRDQYTSLGVQTLGPKKHLYSSAQKNPGYITDERSSLLIDLPFNSALQANTTLNLLGLCG